MSPVVAVASGSDCAVMHSEVSEHQGGGSHPGSRPSACGLGPSSSGSAIFSSTVGNARPTVLGKRSSSGPVARVKKPAPSLMPQVLARPRREKLRDPVGQPFQQCRRDRGSTKGEGSQAGQIAGVEFGMLEQSGGHRRHAPQRCLSSRSERAPGPGRRPPVEDHQSADQCLGDEGGEGSDVEDRRGEQGHGLWSVGREQVR